MTQALKAKEEAYVSLDGSLKLKSSKLAAAEREVVNTKAAKDTAEAAERAVRGSRCVAAVAASGYFE